MPLLRGRCPVRRHYRDVALLGLQPAPRFAHSEPARQRPLSAAGYGFAEERFTILGRPRHCQDLTFSIKWWKSWAASKFHSAKVGTGEPLKKKSGNGCWTCGVFYDLLNTSCVRARQPEAVQKELDERRC
ncbi:cytochrome c oxidase subunit 8C, mitochondrial isoform X2 [Macaca nemestrina]|uniref:cytochrome c oxidase subunit 8C, mitochondrial isoform X2 n=1 Tax=Macaca fascicularis TaxID=9541 RepID=UPI001E258E07|nr:uncharacterized protein LOC102122063 isoform X2 [Macaca fascicularis]